MPALTSPQITTWRSAPAQVTSYCFIHAPTTVFAARVNMASVTYPSSSITFDTVTVGAYTDLEDGMTLLLGSAAGLDDLGRVRVRANNAGTVASSTVVQVQRFSRGVRDGELNISDNMYITVLKWYPIWAKPPYIDEDGVIYKDGDITWSANKAQPPVANAGPDTFIVVESDGSTHQLDFGQVASFTTKDSATISTYAWVFPGANASIPTSSSATPSVTFTAPYIDYIKLTVTDSNSQTHTARALIVVLSKSSASLINEFQITQHTARADGHTIGLVIDQDLSTTTYPDGAEVMITQHERYGDASTDSLAHLARRQQSLFVGWLDTENNEASNSDKGLETKLTFNCISNAGRIQKLPGFSLRVDRKASPANWYELPGLNIDRYVHHILHWHSTVLQRADFTWSSTGDTYAARALSSDNSTLYEMADLRTQALAYKLTCDRYGRLKMTKDPQLFDIGSRTSTVIVPIAEADWSAYRYSFTRPPRVHWNWGDAIVADTSDATSEVDIGTVFCVAPGKNPGQGASAMNSGRQLVTGQNELNVREGHRYAVRQNHFWGYITVDLSHDGDAGIDPALMEWVQFEITSNAAGKRGRSIVSTTRFLPIEVQYQWNALSGTRKTTLIIEKESSGTPAETFIPPVSDISYVPFPDYDLIPDFGIDIPMPLPDTNLFLEPTQAWAVSRNSEVAFVTEFDPVNHTFNWQQNSHSGLSGTPMWGLSDPWKYTRKYILTDAGLYMTENIITTSGTFTSVANNATIFGDAARIGHKMIMSINRQGWMMIASGTNMVAYTINYGASWTQIAVNGAAASWGTSNSPSTTSMDIAISSQNSNTVGWVYAVTGGSTYSTYRTENYGVSWSLRGSDISGQGRTPRIHVPHTRIGGAPNVNDGNQLIYAQSSGGPSDNGRTVFERSTNAGTSYTDLVFSGTGASNMWFMSAPAMSPLTAYTHDGGYVFSVGSIGHPGADDFTISRSVDGFTSNTRYDHTPDGFKRLVNVVGWPYQRDWALFFSPGISTYDTTSGFVQYTDDSGVNSYDVTPAFFTSGFCVYAEFDLSVIQ